MAQKQAQIGPGVLPNIMPGMTKDGLTVIVPTTREDEDDEVKKMEKYITRLSTRQALTAEMDKLKAGLAPAQAQKGPATKKYLVDPKTGIISVDEQDEDALSYKDALIVSASVQGQKGNASSAIELITALREYEKTGTEKTLDEIKLLFQPKTPDEPKPKKSFTVDDAGTIEYDAENGELTLSEARAVSTSKRALMIPQQNTITPDRLELMKRDTKDEMKELMVQQMKELESKIAPKLLREEEPAFIMDGQGKLQINPNPKARISITEVLAWQVLQREQNPTTMYKDREGNILPLPDAINIKKTENEERRKDEMHSAKLQMFAEGRKQLPALIDGLKGMRASPAEDAMKRGGWAPEQTPSGPPLQTTSCPVCQAEVRYATIPSLITCAKCGSMNFMGSPEQLQSIKAQLGVGKEAPRKETKASAETSLTTSPSQEKSSPEDTLKDESSKLPNPS